MGASKLLATVTITSVPNTPNNDTQQQQQRHHTTHMLNVSRRLASGLRTETAMHSDGDMVRTEDIVQEEAAQQNGAVEVRAEREQLDALNREGNTEQVGAQPVVAVQVVHGYK